MRKNAKSTPIWSLIPERIEPNNEMVARVSAKEAEEGSGNSANVPAGWTPHKKPDLDEIEIEVLAKTKGHPPW